MFLLNYIILPLMQTDLINNNFNVIFNLQLPNCHAAHQTISNHFSTIKKQSMKIKMATSSCKTKITMKMIDV